MADRDFRILVLAMGLSISGAAQAEPPVPAHGSDAAQTALLDAQRLGRRGLRTWATGVGLKTFGGGMLWLRIQSPPTSLAVQQGMKTTGSLAVLVGVAMVHAGAIMELAAADRGVRVLRAQGRAPQVNRVPLGWGIYAGSIGLPPLRPVSVYLGHQQLEDLEVASTHSPR